MRKPRFTDFILGLLTEPRDVAAAQFSAPGTITVVVHGIGWGHHDSWTNSFARHWRIGPVEEINFNQGVWPWESFYNFFAVSHEWAQCIHTALRTIIARHTGARINIIAHSWGSLVSYLSLQGGDVYHLDERYEIPPLDSETLGDSTIGNYLTLGSPLGLMTLVGRMPGKPKIIQGEWYNFVSPADPVCASSWNLPEARNIILGRETAGNAPRHIDYWSDPEFTAWLREITQA